MASEEDDQYESEIVELKENVKNLTDCLHTVTKRLDELEKRRRKNLEPTILTSHVTQDHSGPKEISLEKNENTTNDGSTITKRIHVTERVVTTKTYQSMSPSDSDFQQSTQNGYPEANDVRVIGVKKKKGDTHLVSTAYSARVSRCTNPVIADLLQGLTVREEDGQLVVGRVLEDSPLSKQGLIRVGDRILEVNGVEVKKPDELQDQLKKSGEGASLKIVPSGLVDTIAPNGSYVKAFIDYNPEKDNLIPCKEIGLSFKTGDILQIISRDDPNWWQARKVTEWSRVGLIPSQTLEESRRASTAEDGKKQGFDKHDILTYEEVGKLSPYGRRVLVLLGAPGVGRRTLKLLLLKHDSNNFATVVPFTSRNPREGEQEGREYHFVSREKMQKDVEAGNFLEYGEYNNNMYGTTMESVRNVVRSGRMCVLDCSPQAVKYLYSWEFMPYIVFVAPPRLEELKQLYQVHPNRTKPKTEAEMAKTCEESEKMEEQYSHVFDFVLVNRNVDVTFRRLADALEALKTETQWVPISWLYG